MSRKRLWGLLASVGVMLVVMVTLTGPWQRPTLYFNAVLHTFDDTDSIASAVVTRSDRIVFVGSDEQAENYVKNRFSWLLQRVVRRTDLHGLALLPGFVDGHSHFLATGLTAVLPDLSPPASGGSIQSTDALYAFVAQEASVTPSGDWIVGFNYDNTAFDSGRHPTRVALDAVTSEHPVFVRHNSGHMGVANTLALEYMASDDDLPASVRTEARERLASFTPPEDSGLLQELAAPPLGWLVLKTPWRHLGSVVFEAIDLYARQGYTTVQSGSANQTTARVLRWLTRLGWIPQRVVVWPLHRPEDLATDLATDLASDPASGPASDPLVDSASDPASDPALALASAPSDASTIVSNGTALFANRRYTVGPTKLIVDGSPQGYTAYLSQPYHRPLPGTTGQHQDHSLYSTEALTGVMSHYLKTQRPMAIHTNGDGAIEQVLSVLDSLTSDSTVDARRVVLVHAQTIRPDQITRLAATGVTPSYFPGHTWHWGEWHYRQSLGPERASMISPGHSTAKAGVRFSIHTDAPVTPTDSMQLLWMATQRQTQQQRVLGAEERLTRRQALRAMTIDPAWQNRVEHDRGSIEVGKFADFVVLSEDPLTVDDVRTVRIKQTIVGGRTIYREPLRQ